MVADMCHFVLSCFRGEKAKRRHAKIRQMVTCFRMATFRHATRKYATFHALRFRLLFVVSLPGEAKGSHAKTRQNHHLAGFRVATFRVFAPKTRLYDMAQISHHMHKHIFSQVTIFSQCHRSAVTNKHAPL